MKRNAFITAALEELQQEVATSEQSASAIATPTADEPTTPAPATTEPAVVETNLDQSVDAVAALMQKNTELATENMELDQQVFDNDLDVVESSSDSVQQDLEEAVAAGIALEELAHICDLTAKTKHVNKANVASLAFALEQITNRVNLPNPVDALEDDAVSEPKEQVKSIGEKAKELAKKIATKLAEGIQRIIAWVGSFFEQIFTRTKNLAEKARALKSQVAAIDDNAVIEDNAFVARLRLLDNQDSVETQFEKYSKLASTALYGFFNDEFVRRLSDIVDELRVSRGESAAGANYGEILDLIKQAREHIFTESTNGTKYLASKDNDATTTYTEPCMGGLQLYLTASTRFEGTQRFVCKTGLAGTVDLRKDGKLPTINKQFAEKHLELIAKWMEQHREIEKRFRRIRQLSQGAVIVTHGYNTTITTTYSSAVLRLLASFATSVMPHLIQLNIQNSKSFIAYVEKSVEVSKAAKA